MVCVKIRIQRCLLKCWEMKRSSSCIFWMQILRRAQCSAQAECEPDIFCLDDLQFNTTKAPVFHVHWLKCTAQFIFSLGAADAKNRQRHKKSSWLAGITRDERSAAHEVCARQSVRAQSVSYHYAVFVSRPYWTIIIHAYSLLVRISSTLCSCLIIIEEVFNRFQVKG